MKKVGAFAAKTHFSALLVDAERGETIIVTRKGKPVAKIGPIDFASDKQSAEGAMKALLSMRATLGRTTIRQLIEDGRKR